MLRPYSEPELDGHCGAELRRRYAFNRKLSSIRIYIEHTFGLFKSRFQSLRKFGRHEDIQQAYRVIQALMVVHNLCIDLEDHPMEMDDVGHIEEEEGGWEDQLGYGGSGLDEAVQLPEGETEDALREEGWNKREEILNKLFPLADFSS